MRTKALFVAAATGIAALTTSLAQVYSVNVVGYINVDMVTGYNMVANQLDNGSGNLIVDVVGDQLGDGSVIYKYTGTGYEIITRQFGQWNGTASALAETMAPGEGVFVRVTAPATVTFVGEVDETSPAVSIPTGFSIFSSVAPVGTDLSAAGVTWPAEDGDVFYAYDQALNGGDGGYNIYNYQFGSWVNGAVVLDVGDAIWVRKVSDSTWTRDFSVPRG